MNRTSLPRVATVALLAFVLGPAFAADTRVHFSQVTAPSPVQLPLEVLGDGNPDAPLVVEAGLALSSADLSATTRLWFVCHRCGFYGAPEFEATTHAPTTVKASFRILGGLAPGNDGSVAWTDITDANVTLPDAERIHGGINGGFYTTHITVPLDAATRARLVALPASNRIQFRFNGTDGESNGFRIVDLQLRDEGGKQRDSQGVVRVDPKLERTAGAVYTADVDTGRALWYGRDSNKKSSIVDRTIHAACAQCHADNGRDLEYFNYSNNAIVARGRFHGLSDTQARQIVAYLRYSLRDVPFAALARPWNPPYQPGPGMDCTGPACEIDWAAGAGIDAVLDTASEAMQALFQKPIGGSLSLTQDDIDRVMDPHTTLNVRETRIPMQFPDWDAWLPTIHPDDIWADGGATGSFEDGAVFSATANRKLDPNGQYHGVVSWLAAHLNPNGVRGDWSHLSPDDRSQAQTMFTDFGWEAYNFIGGGRGDHISTNGVFGAQVGGDALRALASPTTMSSGSPSAFTREAFVERAVSSVLHWSTVKQWEITQDYALEGNQQWFIGEKDAVSGAWNGRGEAHGWVFNAPSAFYLAPHMLYQDAYDANGNHRQWILGWETDNVVASYYRTNQWYQLQMTINAGGQSGWVNYPMDWPYLTGFDENLGNLVGDADPVAKAQQSTHFVRLLQARIKSAQYVNNDIVLYDPNQPDLVANAGRYGRAQTEKHLTPTNFMDNGVALGIWPSKYRFLDELQPGLFLEVVNGSIAQFNGLYATTAPSAWRRCDPSNTMLGDTETYSGFRYCMDAGSTPLGVDGNGRKYMIQDPYYRSSTEQTDQFGVWEATRMGAEPKRLATWSAWLNRVWPASGNATR
ncbi:MAG TPA: hypothetical protein VM621_13315 [Luteibacter sp.]|uniref:hypothetical protein n=1 Tax=Luteibacter sp. TaxID=1886636 RepID=UPI002C05CC10|nr:hypothetical protein [Luteibacter sp.]HVI56016.1 hypothetical protein [Luteibacter sp.]